MAPSERTVAIRAGDVLAERYEIAGCIGGGRSGVVHLGKDRITSREVAVKVSFATDPMAGQDALIDELRAYGRVSHPGVPNLIDVGVTPSGSLFAVFERIPGGTLRDLLDADGPMAPAVALRLMGEVLDALAAVHKAGVVHRDIKPENIMVTRTGAVRRSVLLDFGFGATSRQDGTASPEMLGTPRYAAPEQLRGAGPTPRSDIYSWALTLIECLGGVSAVRGETARDAFAEQLSPEPVPIPEAVRGTLLAGFLARAVEKDPQARFADATEAIGALVVVVPKLGCILDDLSDGRAGPTDLRLVTVLSARLCGLSAFDCYEELRREYAAAAQLCRRGGATVVSALGHRLVAVFGLRTEQESDPLSAVDTAFALIERPDMPGPESGGAAWSIGMHTGTIGVFRIEGDHDEPEFLTGSTIETAVGLDMIAGSRRILLTDQTAERIRHRWSVTRAGSPRLAGLEEAVASFRPRRRRGEDWNRQEGTAFTGRTNELETIRGAWEAAGAGRPRVVFLSGGAGLGKSRLVREARYLVADGEWLEAGSAIERQTVPLDLLVGLVRSLGSKATSLSRRYRLSSQAAVPALATLIGEPVPAGYHHASMTPERQRELTVRAAIDLLVNMSDEGPTAIVLEDLQWADSSSLDFIRLLIEEMNLRESAGTPLPLLLLLTAREEFARTWNEPGVIRVEIESMGADDAEAMIRAGVTGDTPVDEQLLAAMVTACAGNALFLERAIRLVDAHRAGGLASDDPALARVPASLPALLATHITLLGSEARLLVQVAAAIGQEFHGGLVAAVTGLRPLAFAAAIAELARAGFVSKIRGNAQPRYSFTHALIREAAYESLPPTNRAAVHRRIAEILDSTQEVVPSWQPSELAIHYELAQEDLAAADLWHRSGVQALATASYPEACKDLERGARLLKALPETPERAMRLLGMTTALGSAQVSMKGFGAPETRETFIKARRLCDQLHREVPLEVLGGIFGAALANADAEEVAAVLPHFRSLSMRTDEPLLAFSGHQVLAVHSWWCGRFDDAHRHATSGIELYRREAVHGVAWEFGFGIHCHAYGMVAQFHRGFPDQAEMMRQEMMKRAQSNGNPHCLAVALGWSTTLTHDCGRGGETLEMATRLAYLSKEQHLDVWSAFALCGQSSAFVELGRVGEAVDAIRRALAILKTIGFRCSYSYYLTYLARALIAAGDWREAGVVVSEGMALCGSIWTRMAEAEHVRLHGIVLEQSGDRELAYAELRRAVTIAGNEGNKALELRALTDLARLPGVGVAGSPELDELIAAEKAFREGFSTIDVRRARTTIQQSLGSGSTAGSS